MASGKWWREHGATAAVTRARGGHSSDPRRYQQRITSAPVIHCHRPACHERRWTAGGPRFLSRAAAAPHADDDLDALDLHARWRRRQTAEFDFGHRNVRERAAFDVVEMMMMFGV
jgi:hypothetical protein